MPRLRTGGYALAFFCVALFTVISLIVLFLGGDGGSTALEEEVLRLGGPVTLLQMKFDIYGERLGTASLALKVMCVRARVCGVCLCVIVCMYVGLCV